MKQGLAILDDCASSAARDLRAACPDIPAIRPTPAVFLHGDLVPANIIAGPGGLTFVDWQCPAIGDPVEDLATFLSPAMQSLYGGRSLGSGDQAWFLNAYGNENAALAYHAMKPLFHWRMAAHCLWKAKRGSPDYADAMALELAALELC